MAIGGKKREQTESVDYAKKVGMFEANVIAINPDAEQYKDVLGMELKEDSKATEYLGESKDGNTTLRVDIWLQNIKDESKYKATFFLEDKQKTNKDESKKQYINNIGNCSWAANVKDLPEWFSSRDYRIAYVGEEELYNFLKIWLGALDQRDVDAVLELDWKKLMKGNVKEIANQIDGELCTPVGTLATIKTVFKEDESKEYQSIYNKGFFPTYFMKFFRLVDYSNEKVLSVLKNKKSKDLKPYERYILNLTGEYGCKDFFIINDLKDYDPEMNLVASDKVLAEDDADY